MTKKVMGAIVHGGTSKWYTGLELTTCAVSIFTSKDTKVALTNS